MKNEGILERCIQAAIASALGLAAVFWVSGALRIILFVFSALFLAFSAIGFCPIYAFFGVNTCRPTKDKE